MRKELFVLHCTWQNTIVMSQLHSTHFPSYKYLEGTRFPLILAISVGTYHFGWSQHTKLTFPPNRRERVKALPRRWGLFLKHPLLSLYKADPAPTLHCCLVSSTGQIQAPRAPWPFPCAQVAGPGNSPLGADLEGDL